jgi:D-cysteine desulfhydrase/L-cysteate sulfo-lyase
MAPEKQKPPFTPEQIRQCVARFPRVRLASLPTPLQGCPNLTKALRQSLGRADIVPRLFIKRDDLTGLAFGGNKTRNLEFRMAEALNLGADVMVAGLEAQSNSARQTTAAANMLGMKTILLLIPAPGMRSWQGNVLVNRLLGAEVRWLKEGENMDQALRAIAAEQREAGHTPYVMNHASFFAVASCLAYVLSTLEIHEQLEAHGAQADAIYLSSASKGQAGVVLGALALGGRSRVVGISARPGGDRHGATARIVNETAGLLGWDVSVTPADIINEDRYTGPGYGVPTESAREAIMLLARTDSVLTDPVYTGKALAGLLDHIRQGRYTQDQSVVFIHTGGLPALFAYADDLMSGTSEVGGKG